MSKRRDIFTAALAVGAAWTVGKVVRKGLDRAGCGDYFGGMGILHHVHTATAPATPAVEQAPTLNALDRCDRCPAQALVQVMLSPESALLFCGHHFNANASALDDYPVAVDNRPVVA